MRKALYTFFALFLAFAMVSCSDSGVDIIDVGNGDDNEDDDEEEISMIYKTTFNVDGGGTFIFTIDMEGATIEGEDLPDDFDGDVYTFDPENDKVFISGSLLEWPEPGTEGSVEMTTDGTTGVTIEGGEVEFKFFILPSGLESTWNYGEWEGGPNRVTEIASGGDFHGMWGDKPEEEDDDGDVEAPEAIYMIGVSVGGWDWEEIDLPMIPVADKPGLFWKIVWIEAGIEDGGFKFAPEKDWGSDFGYDGNDPEDEIYQAGSDNVPAPEVSGYYMVVVNWTGTDDQFAYEIAVTQPLVYLIGETVGAWDQEIEDALFTVDNENEVITITRELTAADLRMYAWFDKGWFTDWWQSEFMIYDGEIEFRGSGGDQEPRVALDADGEYTIELNFKTGAGSIEAN